LAKVVDYQGLRNNVLDSLQVFEGGGDSDDEFSGGFGCKENRKSSPQVVNVGSDERSDELSLPLGKGAVLNISTVGCERSPWHAGKSPPSSNIRAGGNGLKSKVKPHASTSSTKRSSLWGLSSVCLSHPIVLLSSVVVCAKHQRVKWVRQ
jgi:hypothetical protein